MTRGRIAAVCVDAWLTAFFGLARSAPSVLRLVRPLALRGAWALSPATRHATRANAARLLGPQSTDRERDRLARAVLGSCFDAVMEIGTNQSHSVADLAESLEATEGLEQYASARAKNLGAILVTAHMGPFETAMAILRTHEPNVHVVFRRDRLKVFERLRSAQHARLGVVEAPSDDGLKTWIQLRDALSRNEVVVMQGDRVMPGQPGAKVPFLGGHMLVPVGPVKLARITGSPIVPVFAARNARGRIVIHLERPIWPETLARPDSGSSETDPAILELARVIERYVRQYPEQWLCLHPVAIEDSRSAAH